MTNHSSGILIVNQSQEERLKMELSFMYEPPAGVSHRGPGTLVLLSETNIFLIRSSTTEEEEE